MRIDRMNTTQLTGGFFSSLSLSSIMIKYSLNKISVAQYKDLK